MYNTHGPDADLVMRRVPHGDAQLTEIEFVDMEPLDHDCDIVGVSPCEAVAIIPSVRLTFAATEVEDPRAIEDLPTEEFGVYEGAIH